MAVILGLGCDRRASLLTLETAVQQALDKIDVNLTQVHGIASIDKKNDEVAILQLADKNQWTMFFFQQNSWQRLRCLIPLKWLGNIWGHPVYQRPLRYWLQNRT